MTTEQQTLDGEGIEVDRDEHHADHSSYKYCLDCDSWFHTSERELHSGHHVDTDGPPDKDDDEEEEDGAMKVGALYDVRLHYTVTRSMRIPAYDEFDAVNRANELVDWSESPSSADLVHEDVTEIKELFEDDEEVPERLLP